MAKFLSLYGGKTLINLDHVREIIDGGPLSDRGSTVEIIWADGHPTRYLEPFEEVRRQLQVLDLIERK
jgi:hypothetical protein